MDYSYLYDGKGNVSALINTSQNVAATYTYDAFGNLMTKTGILDQPFMFSTKEYDLETGLSYYGFRYYALSIGRWITRDPIGEAGGINLYQIVGNSAMNWVDPYGLEVEGVHPCGEWLPCRFSRPAYCEAKFGSPCRASCEKYLEDPDKWERCLNTCSTNHRGCLSSSKCPYDGLPME